MNHPSNDQIGVIGGGLGGLAAACTLAARGHKVICLERNSWFGGKAAVLEADGFRFDMGPTILTLPSVLVRIFSEAGRELSDALDLIPLDPQWRCFFDDGSTLDLVADTEEMARRVAEYSGQPSKGEGYRRFMRVRHRTRSTRLSRSGSRRPPM
jgi:phytoene dehydrogenase-like protein